MAMNPKSTTRLEQDIEQLKERHRILDRNLAVAREQLKTAEQTLAQLKEQAKASYGTDNLDELKAKLEAIRQENERKRAEYQKHLDEIEANLAKVDQQYATARRT